MTSPQAGAHPISSIEQKMLLVFLSLSKLQAFRGLCARNQWQKYTYIHIYIYIIPIYVYIYIKYYVIYIFFYYLTVVSSQNSYVEAITLNVTIFGDRACEEAIKVI